MDDFLDRVAISIEQVTILIRIDAFRFCGVNKRELMWKAHLRIEKKEPPVKQKQMFRIDRKEFEIIYYEKKKILKICPVEQKLWPF